MNSINPTNPTNPTNPMNPKNPINPTNPINPKNPMNSKNPINPINLAVVGTGNWGKNLVRNFCELLGVQNVTVCDTDENKLETIATKHPGVKTTADFENLVSDEAIQALVIATPAVTHFELTKMALQQGKHVLVEKPITMEISQAIDLINLAKEKNRTLMVDHLLEYHPAVEEMKRRIDSDELG